MLLPRPIIAMVTLLAVIIVFYTPLEIALCTAQVSPLTLPFSFSDVLYLITAFLFPHGSSLNLIINPFSSPHQGLSCAKGEITKEQFDQMMEDLRQHEGG